MLSFLIGAAVRMLLLAGLVYVTFFVPIGEHTLYGHCARIVRTDEAQELIDAVGDASARTADGARHLLADHVARAQAAEASK